MPLPWQLVGTPSLKRALASRDLMHPQGWKPRAAGAWPYIQILVQQEPVTTGITHILRNSFVAYSLSHH